MYQWLATQHDATIAFGGAGVARFDLGTGDAENLIDFRVRLCRMVGQFSWRCTAAFTGGDNPLAYMAVCLQDSNSTATLIPWAADVADRPFLAVHQVNLPQAAAVGDNLCSRDGGGSLAGRVDWAIRSGRGSTPRKDSTFALMMGVLNFTAGTLVLSFTHRDLYASPSIGRGR